MKRRIFSVALACALSLSLLTSCGGGNGSGSGSTSGSGSSSGSGSISGSGSSSGSGSTSSDGSDQSNPDQSQPGSSLPGGSSSGSSSSVPDGSQGGQVNEKLTLNRTDFSLFKVGATFQLKVSGVPQGATVSWGSSDDAIATVAENGTVTYVSSGSVTMTATAGDLTATCKVYCKPEAGSETPGDGSEPTEGGDTSTATNVDLSAFYTATSSSHTFANLQLADKQIMDAFYAGLSDFSTEQCLTYVNQLSINMGEFALVQVKDSKDVDAVKAIFQARIDAMVNGGAWYPEPTALWTNSSTVVSNGNYIMMVVHADYSAIVSEFNALF